MAHRARIAHMYQDEADGGLGTVPGTVMDGVNGGKGLGGANLDLPGKKDKMHQLLSGRSVLEHCWSCLCKEHKNCRY